MILPSRRFESYLPKVRDHTVPIPRRTLTTELSPPVILAPGPAHGNHAVYGGAAADAASNPDGLGAVVHVRLLDGGDVVADARVREVAAATGLRDLVGNWTP